MSLFRLLDCRTMRLPSTLAGPMGLSSDGGMHLGALLMILVEFLRFRMRGSVFLCGCSKLLSILELAVAPDTTDNPFVTIKKRSSDLRGVLTTQQLIKKWDHKQKASATQVIAENLKENITLFVGGFDEKTHPDDIDTFFVTCSVYLLCFPPCDENATKIIKNRRSPLQVRPI